MSEYNYGYAMEILKKTIPPLQILGIQHTLSGTGYLDFGLVGVHVCTRIRATNVLDSFQLALRATRDCKSVRIRLKLSCHNASYTATFTQYVRHIHVDGSENCATWNVKNAVASGNVVIVQDKCTDFELAVISDVKKNDIINVSLTGADQNHLNIQSIEVDEL